MTPEQIEQAVHRASREELAGIFNDNAADWMRSVNGAEILQAVLNRLRAAGDPAEVARAVFEWVERSQRTEAGRARILSIAMEVLAADEELSPAVLAAMLRGKPKLEIRSVLHAFLSARPQASPAAAAAVAMKFLGEAGLAKDDATSQAEVAAMDVWFAKDAKAAVEYGATLKHMPMPAVAFRQLTAVSPGRAVHLFRRIIDRGADLHAAAEMAFAAAFTAAQFREATAERPDAIQHCLPSFAARTFFDTPSEMPALAKLFPATEVFAHWASGHMLYTQGAMAIASGLADRDLDAARAWLAPLSAEHRLLVLRSAWQFEGLGHPRLAELCVEEPEFFGAERKLRGFFVALSQAPPAAKARALELVPREMRDPWEFEMLSLSIPREFRGHLPGAMEAVAVAPERFRNRLRALVLQSFAAEYPEQARQWMEEHPEAKAEWGGIAAMMPLISDAERGRMIAADQPRDAVMLKEWLAASSDFAAHLAEVNPARGVSWLSTLPEQARSRPAMVLALNWSAYAPAEAAAWARSLPPGNTRDAAAEGMAVTLRHHPEEAFHWAMQIAAPETQFQIVKRLVQDWARADLQTAAWLLEQSTLSEPQRSELQGLLEQAAMRRGGAE